KLHLPPDGRRRGDLQYAQSARDRRRERRPGTQPDLDRVVRRQDARRQPSSLGVSAVMLIEQRIYRLHPGRLGAYLELMENEGLPILQPILGRLIGYFTTEIGDVNGIVHMWGYDSYEDRAARRARLAADPRWQAFTPKILPMIAKMENSLLVPTRFSPIQ